MTLAHAMAGQVEEVGASLLRAVDDQLQGSGHPDDKAAIHQVPQQHQCPLSHGLGQYGLDLAFQELPGRVHFLLLSKGQAASDEGGRG